MTSVSENLQRVRDQIAAAADRARRLVHEVELVAVSKTHDATRIREAADAGQQLFGESRVQEARVTSMKMTSSSASSPTSENQLADSADKWSVINTALSSQLLRGLEFWFRGAK